jgi:hypothetical protein
MRSALFIIFALGSAMLGCSLRPLTRTDHAAAIHNGQVALSAIQSNGQPGHHAVESLIGSPVAFFGGAAPPGGNANLIVSNDVTVDVELRPYRDVRPQAVSWDAWVVGRLKSVDFQKRIIYIRAHPDDWLVRDTE